MTTDQIEIRAEWIAMLTEMVDGYRAMHPHDDRTDEELLESLMDHFVAQGHVKKHAGKYVLARLV